MAEELGDKALFVSTDVTNDESVQAAIEQANSVGTLRYAVIAHGGCGGRPERIVNQDGTPANFEVFKTTIDIYLSGTYNVARLVGASIAKTEPAADGERGALVMTASIAGYEGQIDQSAYAAAKAGVIGLTLAIVRDLSSAGIRVNTIGPGTMKTPMMESVGEEALAKFAASVPSLKRLGRQANSPMPQPLLSSRYVNGEVLRLDGAQRFQPK